MVVIVNVGGQNSMQMTLVEDQNLVQSLLSNRANPAFGEGIRIGSPHRSPNYCHILRCQDRIEGRCELGVAIMNQEADWDITILDLPTQVTRLLCHPGTRRV